MIRLGLGLLAYDKVRVRLLAYDTFVINQPPRLRNSQASLRALRESSACE